MNMEDSEETRTAAAAATAAAATDEPSQYGHGSQVEADPALAGLDSDDADEAYASTISTSYVTSLASDIRRGVEEKGRLYASYGIHKPWIPIDENEVRTISDFFFLFSKEFRFLLLPHRVTCDIPCARTTCLHVQYV